MCVLKIPQRLSLSRCMQSLQYVWVEGWSEDYQRPFFYNQESKQSSWDRPPDLAWRRVPVQKQQI